MENNNLSLYLNEIAKRLWSDHASVMVGAGFSKNASDKFLSWKEIGDILYNKLHCHNPSDFDKAYLDVLKLADEVETTFGKTYLNDLLKEVLPDKEYQTSELHKKLLMLPWKDVFTTNYDTLLEKAATDISANRRYDIVINKDDLTLSSSPRIIKLHGSFPSKYPFIISGEDYRLYPIENAPFVNTVQQSLLENTLCLIGFSGDDPNFLKWIGWIRDNLGKENSPNIYLIGSLSLSCGEQKLLESRNIIPINISCLDNKKDNIHAIAIQKFIDKMNDYNNNHPKWNGKDNTNINNDDNKQSKIEITSANNIKNDNTNTIPLDNNPNFNWGNKNEKINDETSYEELFAKWENERKSYPGWIILPASKRENIYESMRFITPKDERFSQLSLPNDILFLYEFNWRIEKCLYPILNEWATIYESVLDKYKPFDKKIQNVPEKETNTFDWNKIQKAWISLQLSLLRLYREEGWNEKWDNLTEILSKVEQYFSEEDKARYNYEKCLHYVFNFDIDKLNKCINSWKVDISLPYWAAKRATLLAEFDSTNEAVSILEKCLKEVRGRLNLVPINNDYSLVSLESYLMLLYRNVLQSDKLLHRDFNFKSFPNYVQRWNELKQYQCDPWGEINNFNSQLSSITSTQIENKKVYATFDIDEKRNVYSLGGSPENARLSWGYIRFIEETGIPYKLPLVRILNKKTLSNAILLMSRMSPLVATSAMVRSEDKENIEYVYNRKNLSKMDYDLVNDQASEYIELLRTICINNHETQNNLLSTLSSMLPEIISRFCYRMSYKLRERLINILIDIYKSGNINPLADYNTLIKRLINSFTYKEKYEMIPNLLEFPINYSNDNITDPFRYIKEPTKKIEGLTIKKDVIDNLLTALSNDNSNRSIAIYRLAILMRYNLLTDSQKECFGKNLWNIQDDKGFPKQNVFYYFAFMDFPHPENISPVELLKNYIKNTPLDTNTESGMSVKSEKYNVSITYGDIPIMRNIAGTSRYKDQYKWGKESINSLAENVINWWNTNKHYLSDNEENFGPSIAQEFIRRFNNIEQIIVGVITDNFSEINLPKVTDLKNMIDDIPNYKIGNLNIKSALCNDYSIAFSEIETEIITILSSNSERAILDAIRGTITLAKKGNNVTKIMNIVADNLRCCKQEGLRSCIYCLTEILGKEYRKYISVDAAYNINLGLTYMKDYTQINESDDDIAVDNKLQYKQYIAAMLPKLSNYYKSNVVPPIVSEWEKIVTDKNEFLDICNEYINAKSNNIL
jgi:hypothetical protein